MRTVFTLRPHCRIDFIAADMYVRSWKELHRFLKDIGNEFVRGLLAWTHHIGALQARKLLTGMWKVVKECRFADLRRIAGEKLRVCGNCCLGMPGHFDFRDDRYVSCLSICDNFTDIRLGVEPAITPNRRLFPPSRLVC